MRAIKMLRTMRLAMTAKLTKKIAVKRVCVAAMNAFANICTVHRQHMAQRTKQGQFIPSMSVKRRSKPKVGRMCTTSHETLESVEMEMSYQT
eukprot:6474255-Amphidinium_carterae.2